MAKLITEYAHCKGVSAYAIMYEGKFAGRLIANWSDNPAGTVCSAAIVINQGPLAHKFGYDIVGKAGGYGYEKLSQAVWHCFQKAGIEAKAVSPGNGMTEDEFVEWGYKIYKVL